MPTTYREFKEMVEKAGCTIVEKTQHNSEVRDANGDLVSTFARNHGKGPKRDEIKDCYVRNFKKAIKDR